MTRIILLNAVFHCPEDHLTERFHTFVIRPTAPFVTIAAPVHGKEMSPDQRERLPGPQHVSRPTSRSDHAETHWSSRLLPCR